MNSLFTIIAQAEGESGGSILSFILLPLMLLAMYFLIIRPNSKRRREQMAVQSSLEVGDEVMTTSGIIGTITGEDGPDILWLEIDHDVQVRIARGGIQGKHTPRNAESDDDADSSSDDSDAADADTSDSDTVDAESTDGD